tara:strand:+ start:165 stop:350 length:186 start_codon:yes stop_codon:yes gene_type:complete
LHPQATAHQQKTKSGSNQWKRPLGPAPGQIAAVIQPILSTTAAAEHRSITAPLDFEADPTG